jgi:hypothetical protein
LQVIQPVLTFGKRARTLLFSLTTAVGEGSRPRIFRAQARDFARPNASLDFEVDNQSANSVFGQSALWAGGWIRRTFFGFAGKEGTLMFE